MQQINLPKGYRGSRAAPKRVEGVYNMIYAQEGSEYMMLRPVVDNIIELDGACRGMGLFRDEATGDERLYGVFGTSLYLIEVSNPLAGKKLTAGDITSTNIGTIDGGNECIFVAGFTELLIVTKGSKAYVYNQDDGLREITDSDYLPSVSADYDAGRFIFVPADGSPFFWSAISDPSSIDKQDFADAEQIPDPNKACFVRKGFLYVLGSRSVEALQYNITLDTYERVGSNATNTGYVSCLTRYGDDFAFLGANSDGGFDFFYMSDVPQRISTNAISEFFNDEYYQSELETANANFFVWKGIPILVFNLPRHTFVYYGDWAFWYTGSANKLDTWRVNQVQYAYGYLWTGDSLSGDVGNLVDDSKEFGEPVEWEIQTFLRSPPRANFLVRKIYAEVTKGQDPDARVALQLSNDGKIYGQLSYRDVGKIGQYAQQVQWHIGHRFYDFCGIKLRGYGEVLLNVDGVSFD